MSQSLAERVALLPASNREEWVRSLPADLLIEVARPEWWFIARPEQLAPEGDWTVWLILSGRGWGKTRAGAEWLVDEALRSPVDIAGHPTEWSAFGETNADARSVMIEGPSGMLNVLRRRGIPYEYHRMTMQIKLPDGQKIHARGADDADVGRGFNLAGAWLDEIAKWRYAQSAWTEGISPALRTLTQSGRKPRVVVTTTPKPIPLLRGWLKRTDESVFITRGATFDNSANLSSAALNELRLRYAGTRLGRQELYGELLEDVEGALWTATNIDANRVSVDSIANFGRRPTDGEHHMDRVTLTRIVVAIDPAVTSGEDSDETGIIVVGKGDNGEGYVLADRTCRESPDAWARRAVAAFEEFGSIGTLVGESNQGGDMIEQVLRSVAPYVPYKKVHAKHGKRLRAEPIAALYEQNRIHHVGELNALEDQMTGWTPDSGYSPDRLDALVHGIAELNLAKGSSADRWLAEIAPPCNVCEHPMTPSEVTCRNCGSQRKELA